ncbi:MAG: hypothetical protein K6T73_06195 [Candidatus Bathyarchaeota archaeon]|nr:hypothetical protein [Candidatus Bathyarchaeota archaeon]
MWKDKKQKITATGTLTYNIFKVNDDMIEWLDAQDFSLAALGKLIGIDGDNKVKVRVTLEVVQEPCELCGKLTTGDKLCSKCNRIICDECAKTDPTGRYCPTCFNLKTQPTT